jgi:hypothetical protein
MTATIDIKNAELMAELQKIADAHDGALAPRNVVEAARDPDHPLHSRFEWDDSAAAEKYRLAQAEGLIRKVKLHIIRAAARGGPVHLTITPAYASRPSQRHSEGGYEPITDIMADPDKRAELVRSVARELGAIRRKYAQLVELAEVWYAVDTALDDFEGRPAAQADEHRPSA